MQRLVYSPKINAFVQTQDRIVDLSDFIVSGTVSRVVNEVSTAELVIRNPNKRFTKPGNPTFRPMDGITIYMSRIKGRPIQVFTGYLDETPYLQLFPGTCSIRASCTLKRLMYTYVDFGLPFTHDFLKTYGWFPDPSTGQVMNPDLFTKMTKDGGRFTDGSIGNLMFAVLNQMGFWRQNDILIEQFPQGAAKTVRKLLSQARDDQQESKRELEQFIQELIGPFEGGAGGGGGGAQLGATSQEQLEIATIIYVVGKKKGANAVAMLAAFMTAVVESGMKNVKYGDRDSLGVFQQRPSMGWGTPQQVMNVEYAAGKFFERAIPASRGWSGTAGQLAQHVQRSAYPERYDQARSEAQAWLAKAKENARKKDPKKLFSGAK